MGGCPSRASLHDNAALNRQIERNSKFNSVLLTLFCLLLTMSLLILTGGYKCYKHLYDQILTLQGEALQLNLSLVGMGMVWIVALRLVQDIESIITDGFHVFNYYEI